jgi:Spx/MgsR family transcriptional regulator
MTLTVYGIPNCSTVKKARDWLESRGLAYTFHDFKKEGVPDAALHEWVDRHGWEKLVNRAGTTWRKLDAAEQARAADAPGAMALMQAQPSLIKRPVVRWPDGRITVGFKDAVFADHA